MTPDRLQLLSELPPQVRLAPELSAQPALVPTGHDTLDPLLPGGGWPSGLVELLQDEPGCHVWQLVLPGLSRLAREQEGPVVLVDAPLTPFLPSLEGQGLQPRHLLRVQSERPASALWATEQALRCADVPAVLAWLPRARSSELRRLHLAAQDRRRLFLAVRPLRARNESSPARLRLLLESRDAWLQVHILKRLGPPVEAPVPLPAQPPRLVALLASRRRSVLPVPVAVPEVHAPASAALSSSDRSHVLDRALTPA